MKNRSFRPARNDGGWTLLELMLVLAITAILACAAVPSFQDWLVRYQVRAVTHDIENAIRFARNLALVKGKAIYLSPLKAKNWSSGVQLKENQTTVYLWDFEKHHVQVTWQGFQGKLHLVFTRHLHQAKSNGTFLIQKGGVMQKLTVNRLGRVEEKK